MHAIDPHALSVAYRLIHAVGMGVLLGGAIVVGAGFSRGAGSAAGAIHAAAWYERLFWPVMAIQVLTGVGNVGVLGASAPGLDTPWGGFFALKIGMVGVALVASTVRTGAVVQLLAQPSTELSARQHAVLRGLYAATALLVGAVVFLAVRLSHG